MARNRRRAKRLAIGLLPAAATTLAVATGTGTAGANTTTTTHTYTDNNQVQHTCTISLTRTHPFNNDAQVGEGGTAVTGGGANCTFSGVLSFIGATWNDPDGNAQSVLHNSDGNPTFRRFAPIGSDFTTIHEADFSGSPVGCSDNCTFSTTRSK